MNVAVRAKLLSASLLLSALVLSGEALGFVYLHYIVRSGWRPGYYPSSPPGRAYLTEREPWGAWRVPNAEMRQTSRCFSVALRANGFGMRDRDRRMAGDPHRTVVLGDSFAEGWGIPEEQRLSNLLEARLGREFLNFGIENDVGPLQYQLIYEQLAARFTHDRVLILFLPDNDFTDNDAGYWRRFRLDFFRRHRPYYEATDDGGYRPFYPAAAAPQGWFADGLEALRRNSWLLATLRYLRLRFLSRPPNYSGYVDFTDDELRAVLWTFRRIKAAAGDRQVTVVVIPRPNDFRRVRDGGGNRLGPALARFGRDNGIRIVDLLPLMPTFEPHTELYFLPCDGHWSALGNRVAAEALLSAMAREPGPEHAVSGAAAAAE